MIFRAVFLQKLCVPLPQNYMYGRNGLNIGRTWLLSILFLLSLLCPIESTAGIPQELNRITLGNETGYNFVYVFYTPSFMSGGSQIWGPNILSVHRTLPYGSYLNFFIHYPENCALFDFHAIDSRQNAYGINRVEICNGTEGLVIFEPRHRIQGPRDTFSNLSVIEIINNLETPVWFLFASPQSYPMWGFDLLTDSGLLGQGEAYRLEFPNRTNELYDILAVDVNGTIIINRVLLSSLVNVPIFLSQFREDP